MERISIHHLSGLEACNIRLSTQANRKRINIESHRYIHMRVIKFLKMMVKQIDEIIQNMELKRKGGSEKINWKIFNTIIVADRKGYRNTNCPGSSERSSLF
jgi:hypothetical protein